MPKLKKIAIDIEELLSSPRFMAFRDFQKWWFMAIVFAMWNQRMPGYCEITPSLFLLVGAHRREMWETHSREVVAAFQRVQVAGKDYLYSAKVEALWGKKQKTYQRMKDVAGKNQADTVVLSIASDFSESIWKDYPEERQREKPRAIKEINLAIQRLAKATIAEYKDRFGKTRLVPIPDEMEAARFLHEAVVEYRESPEGRNIKYVPYPERFFRADKQKYLESRSSWFVEGVNAKSKTQQRSEHNQRVAEEMLAGIANPGAATDGDAEGNG